MYYLSIFCDREKVYNTSKMSISSALSNTPSTFVAIAVSWVASVARFVATPAVFVAISLTLVDMPAMFVSIEESCVD